MTDLKHQLRCLRRLLRLRLLALLLLCWLLLAALLLLSIVAMAHLGLSCDPWPVLAATVALALAGVVVAVLARRLRDRRVARVVERHYPALREALLTAVELLEGLPSEGAATSRPGAGSPQLVRAAIRQAEEALALIPRRSVLDLHRLRPLLIATLVATLVAGGLTVASRDALAAMSVGRGPVPRPIVGEIQAPAVQRPAEPPLAILGLQITLQPPEYSQLPPKTVTAHLGKLAALPGTRVTLSALDPPQADLKLQINDRGRVLRPQDGGRLAHEFTLSGPARWELTATDGRRVRLCQGTLRLIADNPPTVRIRAPGRDLVLKEARPLKLDAVAVDDYGLREIAFEYRLPGEKRWRRVWLPASGVVQHIQYEWDLLPLKLQPGQSVSYRLVAHDDSPLSAPGSSRTYKVTLAERLPQEAVARLQQAAEDQRQAVERLRDEAEAIRKQIEELQQRSGPESAQAMGELQQAAQRLQKQAEELRQALAQSEQEVQRHGDALPELSRRLAEANRLLREVLDTKLQEALRQLQQAAAARQQAAPALEQARQAQEELLQRLDQLLALLKQAQMEGLLGELRQRIDLLARQQQALIERREQAERAGRDATNALKDQGRDQQDLARQADETGDKMQEAARQAADQDEQIGQKLQALAEQMKTREVAGLMRQAAGALKQAQPAQAAPPQQQALQALQELSGDLSGLQASVYQQMRQELTGAALELAERALALSERQERLRRDITPLVERYPEQLINSKPALERLARRQELISQGTQRLTQRLQELAGKSPLVDPGLVQQAGEAVATSVQAQRDLSGGAMAEAQAGQEQTMTTLNRLAAQLVQSQQGFQQASAQMALQELMRRLQQLAQQQQGLNQATREGATGEPQAGGQLAGQQAGIREGLQQMLGQLPGAGQPMSGLGEQLGGLPAQMDEVEEDLRGGQVTQRTYRQQEQILHKMLDAQRSLYNKERESRERIAEAPRPYRPPASPPALRPTTLQPLPLRASGGPRELPLGYEDLTRKYFEALGKTGQR